MGDQSPKGETISSKNKCCLTELSEVSEENLSQNDSVMFEEIKKSKIKDGYEFSINDSRFDLWMKALMLRYWVDFGNQSKYRVN